jgi:hypothetical protein
VLLDCKGRWIRSSGRHQFFMIVRFCKKSSYARGPDGLCQRTRIPERNSREAGTQTGRRGRRKHRVPKGMPGEIDKDLEKDLNAKVDDMEDKRLAFYDQQQKANLFLTRRRGTSCVWRVWTLW